MSSLTPIADNEDEAQILDAVDRFLERDVAPVAHDLEASDTWPAEIVEKMVGGRINKFLKEVSLTDQPFVKDPNTTVGQLVKDAGAEVLAFERLVVGEGIEKEEVDFAAEVMAQAKG